MGTNDLGFTCQHAVDHAVFFGLFRGHPVVAIAVCPNLVEIGVAVLGAEGKRSALPHSRVMIHQPLGGAQGQASDIEITAREIMKLKKELYTIISEHSHTEFDKVWLCSEMMV